jgi:serine/threonine protein kinase
MPSRLARGVRVGDRYRLERELGAGEDSVTWEAVDERLDRPVALRIFDASLDRRDIVTRAGKAASLTHPRVVRVFDTGEDAGRYFTVSELVEGSLATTRLPLGAETALRTATDIAEALHYAHERGVVHGHLTESNVQLSESGAKVGDFALAQTAAHADRDDDLRSFGTLMKRVSRSDAAGPPGFVRIIEGLASGAYTSAAEALNELRALAPPPVTTRSRRPRKGWRFVVIALLIGLIAFGVLQFGERRGGQHMIPGGRIEGTPLGVSTADDLDPPPGDGAEGSGSVRAAIDGDASTFWSTERYRESADFNGNKDGVGLILDMSETREIGKAQILWVAQGCSFELRYSTDLGAPVAEWGTAAKVAEAPVSTALEFPPANARYWLVWVTRLTAAGSGFQCGIKEADLFAP